MSLPNYPIVNITTEDGLELSGMLIRTAKKGPIIIHVHGTASNFYEDGFIKFMAESFPQTGFSFLSTNNRGSSVLDAWQKIGAAQELFADCIKDIDAWIFFALDNGFTRIVLQGHSLGTEKVVYYMNKGKYKDKVTGVILLAFADSYGTEMEFIKKVGKDLLGEARELVKDGKGNRFLTTVWNSHDGYLPKNADSFLDQFSAGSELSKALPLRQGKDLSMFQKIEVPLLGVIGDQEEYTVVPITDAMDALRKENPRAEIEQIADCDHVFEGKEERLVEIVLGFLNKL